ncbi:hypothetical protein O1611_g8745 [Lasiodiplodia mahajangana]|uniref:Uncharacterized protein n=1 Tax=Lasiodiplodia mahajangana TaxID=1108764 RepID=A0ACC2JBN4_9PEZI|nr:hypothetical protein O1611_g8745 [Lasiodiplodia mahajangana]
MGQTKPTLYFPPRSLPEQFEFLRCIWPLNGWDFSIEDYKEFLIFVRRYFEEKCDEHPSSYFDSTQDSIGQYIEHLQKYPDLTKAELIATVESNIPGDVVGHTFEIAATFLLGIPVGSDRIVDIDGGINWNSTETLGEAVRTRFSPVIPGNINGTDNDVIPPELTLEHLYT